MRFKAPGPKMRFFDFNSKPLSEHPDPIFGWGAEAHESRPDHFRPAHGLVSDALRIRQTRRRIQRRPPRPHAVVPRPVSRDGLRPAVGPRESARHPELPRRVQGQTLPRRISRADFAQHAGRRQRTPPVAVVGRRDARADRDRAAALCRRGLRSRTQAVGLRSRLDDHRSVPHPVSVWTSSATRPGQSTSSTAATWISSGCGGSISAIRSS